MIRNVCFAQGLQCDFRVLANTLSLERHRNQAQLRCAHTGWGADRHNEKRPIPQTHGPLSHSYQAEVMYESIIAR